MSDFERRMGGPDRRRVPRGGRRASDLPGRYPQVLVADSYEAARICCVKYLDRLGFGVLEAGNGPGALAHIDAQSAHVVVIEHGLPDAPVADVAHRLRNVSPAVPLIVMTSDLDVVGHTLTQMPLVTVLEKPFSLTTMIEEIRRMLRWTGREADAEAPALL
jgi:two-component system OmpR family response regulator